MELKYYLFGFISAILVITVIFLGFNFGRKSTLGKKPSAIAIQPVTPTTTQVNILISITPTIVTSRKDLSKEILNILQSKKYNLLENLLVNQVTVRLEGTDCCGQLKAKEALEKLVFLNSALEPWDFSGTGKTVDVLIAADPENYSGAIIGISSNNYIFAAKINSEGKIETISLANNLKQIMPQ